MGFTQLLPDQEHELRNIFQPEVFLASQQDPRHKKECEEQRRLALRILDETFRLLLFTRHSKDAEGKRLYDEAFSWVMNDKPTTSGPFTFNAICELFDWEPSWIRRGILNHLRSKKRGAS